MRLLFIRHGQMEARASNAKDPAAIDRHFAQEREGGLSARGRDEAEQVAHRLRREGVTALYSSPLQRAKETADVSAARLSLPLTVDSRLTELRTGSLRSGTPAQRWVQGWSGASLPLGAHRAVLRASLIPLYFHAWRRGDTEGGETPMALEQRLRGLFDTLEATHAKDATLALFAHGYLLVTITWALGPRARLRLMRRPYIPNGAICELTLVDGKARSRRHADASHLG